MFKQKVSQPVQEVLLPDFPDDDTTVTTTVTKSRRVSFGPNFVKEFIVDSAVTAQCMSQYEQPFSSSDSSGADSSHSAVGQSTFVIHDNVKIHKPADPEPNDSRPKPPKFASTICFSADSPTADMEFTEGCLTLAKSILDKKNKEMTVFIQAKPKEDEKTKEDETNYFDGSQFEMSMTRCLKSKENKREEKRFEKTRIFGKFEDEMSMTRCDKFLNDDGEDIWEESKENRIPLDAIMRHLDKDSSDSDLFNPERSFGKLLGANPFEMSDELDLNESMEISGVLKVSENKVEETSMERPKESEEEKISEVMEESFARGVPDKSDSFLQVAAVDTAEAMEMSGGLGTPGDENSTGGGFQPNISETSERIFKEAIEGSAKEEEKVDEGMEMTFNSDQNTSDLPVGEEPRENSQQNIQHDASSAVEFAQTEAELMRETPEKQSQQSLSAVVVTPPRTEVENPLGESSAVEPAQTEAELMRETPEKQSQQSLSAVEPVQIEAELMRETPETPEKQLQESLSAVAVTPPRKSDENPVEETTELPDNQSISQQHFSSVEKIHESIESPREDRYTIPEIHSPCEKQLTDPNPTAEDMEMSDVVLPVAAQSKTPTADDDSMTEPSLGDLKVIESLQEQSKEPGCVWSLRDLQHPRRNTQGLLSFTCRLLESTASVYFNLKTSDEDALAACSIVTDSSIHLDEDKQWKPSEYSLAVGFGFSELRKHFQGRRQQVGNIRHVPYFLDDINSFLSRMNAYLRQVHTILTSYPGSKLQGSLLSFRLFSFPMFFSCFVSIELCDMFRLSRRSLRFEHDFGCLDEKTIGEIFEESLKRENSLCEFVVEATRHLIEVERRSGCVSKRGHIRLLPSELRC